MEKEFPINPKLVDMESANKIKYENIPTSIFKYRTFDDNHIENLKNNTVWLSDPNEFNDPYDSEVCFDHKKTTDLLIKLQDFKNQDVLGLLPKDFISQVSAELTLRMNRYYKESIKICSFSKTNKSITMWGHYAQNHTGYCIEYDLKSLSDKEELKQYLYPVIYSKELFDITEYILSHLEQKNTNKKYMTSSILYKNIEWEYEEEWRLVFDNHKHNDKGIYGMPPPKAIYMGAKISKENKLTMLKIAKDKNIPVFEMFLDPSEFRMIARNI